MKFLKSVRDNVTGTPKISDCTWTATGESGTVYSTNFRVDRPSFGQWMLECGTEGAMQVIVFGPTQQWIRDWAETLEAQKKAA